MTFESPGRLGATPVRGGTTFRVWAPLAREVVLRVEGASPRQLPMDSTGGYWSIAADVPAGSRYTYLVDGLGPFPDPCSRSQPDGPHGASEVVDPASFAWGDGHWRRPRFSELVVYEAHIGTLTPAGTFEAAIGALDRLVSLGVNALEVMPVASFPGSRGWGYDGVALFAPFAGYGGPEGFRRLIDAAHRKGIAVILDVVLNHFGPDGNYTGAFSPFYINPERPTPWGGAINFDGGHADGVRHFYREMLLHWLEEYHVDGFRFDATHAIFDESPRHILGEVGEAVRAADRQDNPPYLIAETHENDRRYLLPVSDGGFGFDAVWADDFHHAVRTIVQDDWEGYFSGFDGRVESLARTIGRGWLYDGRSHPISGEARGTSPDGLPWPGFIYCIQNHDQVGNRAFGERLSVTANAAEVRAATLLLLLLPQTPMVFQGQEYGASQPFLYFTDHKPGLATAVVAGRRAEFGAFSAFRDERVRDLIPDPNEPATFERSKLDPADVESPRGRLLLDFHRALIAERRADPVLRAFRESRLPISATASDEVLVVTLAAPPHGCRVLAANFCRHVKTVPAPGEPRLVLHSNEGRFGGFGREPVITDGRLELPPRTAAWLALER